MEKILITGATGLLGSNLVPYLKKCGYKVITHANTTQADIMFDLSNRIKSYEFLEQIQPDLIINLVSLTSVELCEEQVNLAYLINTFTVENVTNWIQLAKADCHLVQISTDHVYDGIGLHLEDNVTITNNYALSKYAGELAAAKVPSTILRTNFVGRSKVSSRESLTDWVYKSLIENKHVQVLDDIYFSPLSIVMLVEMIKFVVQKKRVGIYNLGSNNGMSKADFALAFAECLKLPTNTMTCIKTSQATFFKAYRPKNMCMDCTKFEEAFNVKLPNLIDLIQPLAKEYNEIA
jgi:dTDP-4-dehydrorhamnose reductase